VYVTQYHEVLESPVTNIHAITIESFSL